MQQGFNTSIAVRIVTAESAWRAASLCLKVNNSLGINGKPILFFLSVHGDGRLVGTLFRCVVLQEARVGVNLTKVQVELKKLQPSHYHVLHPFQRGTHSFTGLFLNVTSNPFEFLELRQLQVPESVIN